MSIPMTASEIIRALVAQGVPRAMAERSAGHTVPDPDIATLADSLRPTIRFPLYLSLPWSALCSDNTHEKASLTWQGDKPIPRKILDPRYKAAFQKARQIAQHAVGDAVDVMIPLALHARVFVPDERPHDVCNFAKCMLDAMQGVVYANNRWVHRAVIERAGVDVDAPRAEIEVTPL